MRTDECEMGGEIVDMIDGELEDWVSDTHVISCLSPGHTVEHF